MNLADEIAAKENLLVRVAANIRKLGHIALRQGDSFECPRCGAHGSVPGRIRPGQKDVLVTGTIAFFPCEGKS